MNIDLTDDQITEIIHAEQTGKGPSVFKFGHSSLFFIGPTLYAIEYEDRVYLRDDLPLAPRQRRLITVWRSFDRQTEVDRYTFLVLLNDALLHGMSEVREEIFDHA